MNLSVDISPLYTVSSKKFPSLFPVTIIVDITFRNHVTQTVGQSIALQAAVCLLEQTNAGTPGAPCLMSSSIVSTDATP